MMPSPPLDGRTGSLSVRAYPCDASSEDWKRGPVIANNQHGISTGGERVNAEELRWEGIPWRFAFHGSTLWVLAGRDVVTTHEQSLRRLAEALVNAGGAKQLNELLARGEPLPVRAGPPRPRPSTKRMALNVLTDAARDAINAGASQQEIRLAVLSAMGLDSDSPRA